MESNGRNDGNGGGKDGKEPRKVIDISERLPNRNPMDKLKSLKVRLDLEQAKVAIPVSLLSILTVVTLANSKLLTSPEVIQSQELASEGTLIKPSRGIASVPTGTSDNEDQMVKEMAGKTLSEISAVGRKPSALEKLTIETLEGKYAVRMDEGQKISEIQISDSQTNEAIKFESNFLETNRQWMPVTFDKSVRVKNDDSFGGSKQIYHLVNNLSMPVAKVDVSLDSDGRLLSLKVIPRTVAQAK
jgi:hypothetical protein